MVVPPDLLEQRFRANRSFQLISFRRLSAVQRDSVIEIASNPRFHGILRPRTAATLGNKAASKALVALLRTLRRPGALPRYLRSPESADEVARLVLDGILEIEHGGQFVCGAAARHLVGPLLPSRTRKDRISVLSQAAIAYGAALEIADPSLLSARMYFFNRLPLSPAWVRRVPDESAMIEFLGLMTRGRVTRLLERYWARATSESVRGWLMWSPRRHTRRPRGRKHDPTYKLYVSPRCDDLSQVLGTLIGVLAETGPLPFKVCRDAQGILRPDKLVVYAESRERLDALASDLLSRLSGVAAHGIPFTEPVDAHGLISRGIDPPIGTKLLRWHETESWRLWITNRLAVALLTARATVSDDVSAVDFARARLRLDGVDTSTWAPLETDWMNPSQLN